MRVRSHPRGTGLGVLGKGTKMLIALELVQELTVCPSWELWLSSMIRVLEPGGRGPSEAGRAAPEQD